MSTLGAVVLAAGLSSRMGQPKQLMPWGDKPMARHVVDTLIASGVEAPSIVVVVGHWREEVETCLAGSGVGTAFNPEYADGSMLRSLQVGLAALQASDNAVEAALAALGDQPQIEARVTEEVIAAWRRGAGKVVAPIYEGQRGHPILFDRSLWPEILSAPPVGSPRDWLATFKGGIGYVAAESDAVLEDIDTPDDYRQELERRV